jgi:alkylation response protein AidB-like acyl-CoA dehydrogenase
MRFDVAEDAAALRDAAQGLLLERATPAVIRAGWPGGACEQVAAIWRGLADVGVIGALVPEASGGLGLDANCLAPMLEAVGYSGLPVPVVETIAVAAPLLALNDHPALPDVLAGSILVAASFDDGTLVPYGSRADLVVLRVTGSLRLYESAELALEGVAAIDGARGLARLTRPPHGGIALADDADLIEAAWQRGVLGTAALMVGLATRMLDMTVDYVKTRRQFGVPVGSFQAIRHALADALVGIEFARPAVLAAGWAVAVGAPDAAEQTSVAKVLASQAATKVARTAIQCHGAIGYTTEYDLHLFAKRVWALTPSWGDQAWHRARLAVALGLEKG